MGASSASRYNFKWRRFFTFVDFICESSYEDTKFKTKSSNAIVNLQGHTYQYVRGNRPNPMLNQSVYTN